MGAGYSIQARGNANAEVFIYEDVGAPFFGGVSAKDFAADLKGLGKVAAIDVHINSNGGDVFDGLAIYRQLVEHEAKVTTHIDGVAASIASVIAMAGDTIRIAESGFVMIHNATALGRGDAGKLRKTADLLDKVTETIADVYSERTGQDKQSLLTMMTDETWMTGNEALEHGFADEVVVNLSMAARAIDPAMHQFRNVPEALQTNLEAPKQSHRPDFEAANARLQVMRGRVLANRIRTGT